MTSPILAWTGLKVINAVLQVATEYLSNCDDFADNKQLQKAYTFGMYANHTASQVGGI
jgi:hypothetical protein